MFITAKVLVFRDQEGVIAPPPSTPPVPFICASSVQAWPQSVYLLASL